MSHTRMASSDYLFTWCILIWKQARKGRRKKRRDKFFKHIISHTRETIAIQLIINNILFKKNY